MSLSDGAMIAASLAEPVQFAGIFDRHIDHVRKFVIRRLGESQGDDVVSEVFRVAFERRETFDVAADSALPWLYGIAANLVRREHRSHARRLAALGRADGRRELMGDPLLDAAARLDARSELHELGAALIALSDGEREILLLVAWEQLTPSQAAAVLGIPPETARTRLHRARAHIRTERERDGHNNEVTTDAHR
jgi:RNA polymerase sigma-70 factor (ECF subfamily)